MVGEGNHMSPPPCLQGPLHTTKTAKINNVLLLLQHVAITSTCF